MVVACRVHLEPLKWRRWVYNSSQHVSFEEQPWITFWSKRVQNKGRGMYKNRTLSTIFIWAMRSFCRTDKHNRSVMTLKKHFVRNIKEQNNLISLLCPVHPVLPLWVFAAPVPDTIPDGKLIETNMLLGNYLQTLLNGCINSFNHTHPNAFTDFHHDVSLWFSFVVHWTSHNKHHWWRNHTNSIRDRSYSVVHSEPWNLSGVPRAITISAAGTPKARG